MSPSTTEAGHEPPATGRDGGLRIRSIHPDVAAHPDADALTLRLILMIRSHPKVVDCRVEDVSRLDRGMKESLIARFEEALGIDKPVAQVLPFIG